MTSLAKEPSFFFSQKKFNVVNDLKFSWEKYFRSEMALRYRKTPELTKIRKIEKCVLACGQYWVKVSGKSEHFYD